MGNALVIAILAITVAAAIASVIRSRKSGGSVSCGRSCSCCPSRCRSCRTDDSLKDGHVAEKAGAADSSCEGKE